MGWTINQMVKPTDAPIHNVRLDQVAGAKPKSNAGRNVIIVVVVVVIVIALLVGFALLMPN